MSDKPDAPSPSMIPMMTPEKARDIGRAHKSFAAYLADQGLQREASRMERDSAWWLAYAITLANTKPEES